MFSETQIEKIIDNWGQDVYRKLLRDIEEYAKRWKLSDLLFFESYSMNAIVFCTSQIFGECVLKIGNGFQDDTFVWEYDVLREYNGRRLVRVYDSDIQIDTGRRAMLLERISPGTMLHEEKNFDRRLAVFSELFDGMHIKPRNSAIYKRYADGVNDSLETVRKRGDCPDICRHMAKAEEVYASVAAVYPEEMLLHGDLHFHNILLGNDGKYAAIDPQGRIGARVFDIPRYILIEYYNSKDLPLKERTDTINHIIGYLEGSLQIPNEIIRKCFYIETAKFECWGASVGKYDINNIIFAQEMMKR